MTGVKSLVYMAGAQHDVNPREWPFLSDAFLQTPKDESSWTQVTKRANKIHTWSGFAARQSLVRHKLSSSQLKLWFCWQCVSRRCPLHLSLCVLPNQHLRAVLQIDEHVPCVCTWLWCMYESSIYACLRVSPLPWRLAGGGCDISSHPTVRCCSAVVCTGSYGRESNVPPQHTNTPQWPNRG